MTQEEMLQRIRELEAENSHLRGDRKYKVSLVHTFGDEHEWVKYAYESMMTLSKLIRELCFPKQVKETNRRGYKNPVKCKYLLETKDMNDEQKAKYIEIARQILEVLDKYEIVAKERIKHEQDRLNR